MSSENATDISNHEERITEAFGDLARRANAVDVDHGPHVAGAGARSGVGGRGPLLPALAFAVIAAVAGFGGWQLLADDGPDNNIATEDVQDNNEDSNSDDNDGDAVDVNGVGDLTELTEASGVPDTPFLLIETESGTRAGFGLGDNPVDLPADAQDALPDGNGGVFYTNSDTVFHVAVGGEPRPLVLTETGPPSLVSTRKVAGRNAALTLLDGDLVAIFADRAPLAFDREDRLDFGGTIVDVAMDGTTVAAIVNDGDSVSVRVVSQLPTTDDAGSTNVLWTAVPSIEPEHRDAPRNVALAGNLLVVGTAENVRTYTIAQDDDSVTEGPSYPLPASPDDSDWWTFDAAADSDFADLIIGFGESALTIDLNDGTRQALGAEDLADAGSDGWIRAAHWGFSPDGGVRVPDSQIPTERYRVDAEVVAADTNDPFLNVRSGPGTEFPVVAKLPPNYSGILSQGDATVTDDGALWIPIALFNPVEFTPDPAQEFVDHGEGWVNIALLEPLPDGIAVGTDEVPACRDGEFGQLGGTMSGEPYVYGLESTYLTDTCLRVVVSFGQGEVPIIWEDIPAGTGPASALPSILNTMSGGFGSIVDLGATEWTWPEATETDDGVYIVRGGDGGLELVAPMRVDRVNVTALPEQGMVVVDLKVAEPPVVTDQLVVLTEPPLVGAGSVSVNGLARPFEATLGVSVVDADNNPVAGVFSGSSFLGTIETDQYAVSTSDWTVAWGRFSVKVDGLEPGSYTLLLNAQGGSDTPSPTRIAFTITDPPVDVPTLAGDDEQVAAKALIRFAQGGSFTDLPVADEVILSLGLDEQIVRTQDQLADRDNWFFEAESGFGGFDGPFSVLQTLSGDGARHPKFTAGPMPWCAGGFKEWPAEWQAMNQVNIEPAVPFGQSCISWFGVSLFLNDADEIEVIVLDLFGP